MGFIGECAVLQPSTFLYCGNSVVLLFLSFRKEMISEKTVEKFKMFLNVGWNCPKNILDFRIPLIA